MSKKYKLIINIAMVVIGIIGMFIYYTSNKESPTQPQQVQPAQQVPEVPTESITVAVAKKNLIKGIRLTSDDFRLETVTVAQDSGEKVAFAVGDIDNWMVKSEISAGAKIPKSALVEPGSDEYISMSAKPGSIIYGFSIEQSDSYLFTNMKAGGGIDIYLMYNLRKTITEDGNISTTPITETTENINSRHFKLIMKDKKILLIKTAKSKVTSMVSQQNVMDNEGYILVELSPAEVLTLKGLDGAKLVIVPTTKNLDNMSLAHSVLVGNEGHWPVDNRDILSTNIQVEKAKTAQITEYRGTSAASTKLDKKDER